MLSYLLVLSSWTAYGINNSLRSTFLEELAPESTSDSLTLEGIEDDSSRTILAQTEGFFSDYDWVDIKAPYSNGYRKVNEDSRYASKWGSQRNAKADYFACGMKGKIADSSSDYLTGFEVTYCNRYKWKDQYSDKFESSVEETGKWGDNQMCPEGKFIYGFWWVDSDNDVDHPLQDLGFWCDDDTEKYVLKYTSWYYSYLWPSKQWYDWYYDGICGFQAQISSISDIPSTWLSRSGLEGFAIKLCEKNKRK